jgi:hypothetical protein
VRQGVVYTSVGKARFEVPEGEYLVHASRGMEWGVDTHKLQLGAEPAPTIELRIAREVDTTGYVASDTHVHTLQFSGHGDASALERIITLAGEGVELAIATDHNHHTDYQPFQRKLKLSEAFKSVTGSEVTTKNGHFNAFPMPVHGSKPNHKEQDWVKLVDDIRAKGAKVVILNHPRWPQVHTGPFGKQHFELNRLSGTRARGTGFTFDAMELVNATVKAPDPMYNFIDWFALLNHGEKIMAVGSSDSHTVGDPVGQGRTYLRSKTDVPSRIDVDEACRAFVQGRSSISQGLFTEVWVGDRRMGDTATLSDPKFEVRLRIACAGWCHPDRARLYLNGRKVADRKLDSVRGQATDIKVAFELDTPPNDAHLVCVATGPGVKERFWRADRTNNYVLGATNPVYLDVDGDRKYQSPRHQAERLLRQNKTERALVEAVGKVDDAVAVQALGLLPAGRAKAIGSQLTGRKVLERFLAGLK